MINSYKFCLDNNAQITGNHSAKELDTSDLIKSENQEDSLEKNHSSKKKTPPYSVQEFLELATALSTKQQRQHAIVLFKDILKKEPTNQTALIGIGKTFKFLLQDLFIHSIYSMFYIYIFRV